METYEKKLLLVIVVILRIVLQLNYFPYILLVKFIFKEK